MINEIKKKKKTKIKIFYSFLFDFIFVTNSIPDMHVIFCWKHIKRIYVNILIEMEQQKSCKILFSTIYALSKSYILHFIYRNCWTVKHIQMDSNESRKRKKHWFLNLSITLKYVWASFNLPQYNSFRFSNINTNKFSKKIKEKFDQAFIAWHQVK